MPHLWTNVGQEELRPYKEPPCEVLNSQVTQDMRNIGFEQERIEESLREKKYNRTMVTYLILRHKAHKGKGCTIIARPLPGAETSLASSHVSHSIRPSSWTSKSWPVQQPAQTGTPPFPHPHQHSLSRTSVRDNQSRNLTGIRDHKVRILTGVGDHQSRSPTGGRDQHCLHCTRVWGHQSCAPTGVGELQPFPPAWPSGQRLHFVHQRPKQSPRGAA
uniref:UBA domain-containing protein n=1 Tax=Rousettus aegyptiacus TaxID=9407 RepID=A0A7J8B7D7_ROUAE|nr:hypothetical protein HJG63_010470 [Rousettus aegyptiacus]